MERMTREPLALRMAPRCLARTRSIFNEFSRAERDEFEERVFARDVEIAPHTIGMISTPIVPVTQTVRG